MILNKNKLVFLFYNISVLLYFDWNINQHPDIYILYVCKIPFQQIDGSVQERRNSIANALELHLSCTNPLK